MSADHMPTPRSEVLPDVTSQARLADNPYIPETRKRRVAKMTPAKKRKFCEALASGASPTSAAKALGVARSTVYYQRDVDGEFASAWEEALERDADRYEEALEHLATKTRNVGAVIFALKNKRPEKWRDRHEVETNRTTNVAIVLTPKTRAKLEAASHTLALPSSGEEAATDEECADST